jgi:hypothetical protein
MRALKAYIYSAMHLCRAKNDQALPMNHKADDSTMTAIFRTGHDRTFEASSIPVAP